MALLTSLRSPGSSGGGDSSSLERAFTFQDLLFQVVGLTGMRDKDPGVRTTMSMVDSGGNWSAENWVLGWRWLLPAWRLTGLSAPGQVTGITSPLHP